MKSVLTKLLAFLLFAPASFAQKSIPEGSRVYIAPMGGFETNLIAAINNKKVPVVIVGSRSTADFEVAGGAESQKANWMRIWVSGSWRSDEKASIVIKNLHTDVIVYAYEVNKWAAWHGSQSAAEACAKHMKSSIVHVPPEELAAFSASPRAKVNESVVTPDASRGSSESMPIGALGLIATTRGDPSGAEIVEITRDGGLEGLHVGDVITSVNGKPVKTSVELGAELSNRAPGSRIRIRVVFRTSTSWASNEAVVTLQQNR